jgi:hypothetical protein
MLYHNSQDTYMLERDEAIQRPASAAAGSGDMTFKNRNDRLLREACVPAPKAVGLHAVVRFCYFVPQQLLLFLWRALPQHTEALPELRSMNIAYQ